MQVAALSPTEMKETEGAVIPAMVFGAGVGAATYWAMTPASQRTWTGWGTSMALGAIPLARAGSVGNWVRAGSSYSITSGTRTTGIQWGSNTAYRSNIGSQTLQNWNANLRNTRIPVDSWRTNDRGHLHLWRR